MSRKGPLVSQRQALVKKLSQARQSVDSSLTSLQADRRQTNGDMVDAATEAVQDEVSSRLSELQSGEADSIRRALEKVDNGTYGICEGCGKRIPKKRLEAQPDAIYCVKCQDKFEHGVEVKDSRDEDWRGDVWDNLSGSSIDDVEGISVIR
jgi:DnaK suppressor protein